MKTDPVRRRVVLMLAAMAFARPGFGARSLRPTPEQPAGPFYPVEVPLDDDNDLTRVGRGKGVARGQITDLSGRLLDLNGRPIGGERVEIWQCDANGRYRHPRDPGHSPIDPDFQGHGHVLSDVKGRYRFRTIRPVPYPGRTPHIHIAVFVSAAPPFITQLYVKGEARNQADFLFRRIPVEQRERVLAAFVPTQASDVALRAQFDIVLGGGQGTPSV